MGEMAKLTDTEFDALSQKHAGKRLVRLDLKTIGTLVWRQPTKAEHVLFRTLLLDNATTAKAYEHLFLQTIVYPSPEEALKLTEEWAGLTSNTRCVKALNELSGQGIEEEGKGS